MRFFRSREDHIKSRRLAFHRCAALANELVAALTQAYQIPQPDCEELWAPTVTSIEREIDAVRSLQRRYQLEALHDFGEATPKP